MNGTTTIDAGLNPCSAECDRRTYGWKWLNVSTYGERLLCVGMLGIYLDLYPSGWHRVFYVRIANGAGLFFPGGSLKWPMPDISPRGGSTAPLRSRFVDGFLDLIIRVTKGLLALLALLLLLSWWAAMAGCTGLYAGKDVETALRQRSRFAWDQDSNFGTDIDGTHTGAFTMAEGEVVLDPDGNVDPVASRVTSYLTYQPKADNAQNSYIQAAQSAERINERWSQSFDNMASLIATMAMARNLQPAAAPGQLGQLRGDVISFIEAEIRKRMGLPEVPIPEDPTTAPPRPPANSGVTQESLEAFGQQLLGDVVALVNQKLNEKLDERPIDQQLIEFRKAMMADIAALIDQKISEREPKEDAKPEPTPPETEQPPATNEPPAKLDPPLPSRTES